ncbi:MAG: sulfate permease, SulP family [Paraburkholderia sp.]|nr:sulfate permease, SulP family [Paraburkholderia sp.]
MNEVPPTPVKSQAVIPCAGGARCSPPAQWLAAYRPQWLAHDAIAGVTLAAYGIPVSLAYASLAGLPPQYGIYCYLVGGLFYALFGSSRQLAIGPTSAISLLVGVTVADMAGGDTVRWASIAALTALLVGGHVCAGMAAALSSLVNFISETILLGFKVVGALPQGLPEFRLPGLRVRDVDGVIPMAFACLLLSYVESVSAARALAQAHGDEIDPRQELLGLGAANLAAGLFQAYPVAGGLSQSSVNDKAGAKTPLALVFGSITIGLCLMYLTGLLGNLPNVVLAAIVLVAVKGLIDIRELRHLWRVSRYEFCVAMVAFAAVLVLCILNGVIVAVLVSMLLLIRRAADPHVAFLGRIPGTRIYSDIERHPDNEPVPGMLVCRVQASLRSTWLIYEAQVGVKCAWKRGWRASQVLIEEVLCVP